MNRAANSVEGIQSLQVDSKWDAVDVIWCDRFGVDGYLSADFYGVVLRPGWYYEPLVQVEPNGYTTPERCEGPRGPFTTSEQALCSALEEASN